MRQKTTIIFFILDLSETLRAIRESADITKAAL